MIAQPKVCGCGHRLGIHEYPQRCWGVDGNLPDAGRCPCFAQIPWDDIKVDRAMLLLGEVCTRCYLAPAETYDVYGDARPKCEPCMKELNDSRWKAEHGMP